MNDYLSALILGIVQGITEFLPVSSSGHLELAEAIFGIEQKDSIFMTIVLHAATALATVVVYRKYFLELIQGLFQFKKNQQTLYILKIIISMVPAALVGFFFEEQLEMLFDGKILFVGCMLLLTGMLLLLADKSKSTNKGISNKNALLVGISQAIAILPGISRSGATISSSVILGIDREEAARFSFLMVVPLILGVILKKSLDLDGLPSSINYTYFGIGFITAFITGILACKWMIALVKKAKLKYFAYYCFAVGGIAIIYTSIT